MFLATRKMQHSPKSRKGLFTSDNNLRGSASTEDLNIAQRNKRRRQSGEAEASFTAFQEEMKTMINTLFQAQQQRLETLENHIKEVKGQNQDIRSTSHDIERSMDFMCQQLKELDASMKKIDTDNKNLKLEINNLNEKIDYLEHNLTKTCIEIRNVPKTLNETKNQLYNMVITLAKNLNLQITNKDLKDVTRSLNKKEKKHSALVVEFQNTLIKSEFLMASKKFNLNKSFANLSASHLGIQTSNSPIYISELLSKKNKKIFYEAKVFSKDHNYAYCWTSNGRVLLREKDGSPYIIIQRLEQLEDLKNTARK